MTQPTSLRLDRLLANLGYGSRREMPMMARDGRIRLDGEILRDIQQRVPLTAEFAARLSVDGENIDPLPGVVLMLNKPAGVTCSHKENTPLVYDLLPERWHRREPAISAAGRLDKDTSGLLLLTDDGAFLHRIISPRRHIAKRYLATLDRPLQGEEANIFAAGTLMLHGEEKPLLPAMLESISPLEAAVTLTEGRYHQVRRMFAAVKNHVTALRRVAIGGLTLPDDLEPGAFRVLDPLQRAMILSSPSAANTDVIIPAQ
jgi:16S rRNA pseudouridine516 synthase